MKTDEYVKQLEEENTALKKKLEENAVEKYPNNRLLNLKNLSEITEEFPLIMYDMKSNPVCKLVSAYRNKFSGMLIIKFKKKAGIFRGWTYKEMQGWWDEWYSFPITKGSRSSDVSEGLMTHDDVDKSTGFFRMIESVGIINRNDKNVGM
jgi:hypothetical protein